MSSHIRTAVDDGVALIEIARPEKKNALTGEMYITKPKPASVRITARPVKSLKEAV